MQVANVIDLAPAQEAPAQNLDDLLAPAVAPTETTNKQNIDDLLSPSQPNNSQIN